MLINRYYSTLSSTSQKTLYNSFVFYRYANLSNFKKIEIKNKIFSFKYFLAKHLFLVKSHTNSLVWAQLVYINNSFNYLNIGEKPTLVKPKVKRALEISVYSPILLIWDKPFFRFIVTIDLKSFINQVFQYNFTNLKNSFSRNFCLKKLSVYNSYLRKFIIIELKKKYSSIFQKKINFFQFNALFRKYKFGKINYRNKVELIK